MDRKGEWKKMVGDPPGTIYRDWMDAPFRCIIMRGPSCLCAYIGVPLNHVLAGKDPESMDIECHGGMNFADNGDGRLRPTGWYWFGWDYAHYGDYFFFYDTIPALKEFQEWHLREDHKWFPDEVYEEVIDVVNQFKKMMSEVDDSTKEVTDELGIKVEKHDKI